MEASATDQFTIYISLQGRRHWLPFAGGLAPLGVSPAQNTLQRHVRFGSKADICAATNHVRFTPNSDRESGFPQNVMSALPWPSERPPVVAAFAQRPRRCRI